MGENRTYIGKLTTAYIEIETEKKVVIIIQCTSEKWNSIRCNSRKKCCRHFNPNDLINSKKKWEISVDCQEIYLFVLLHLLTIFAD